MLKRSFITAAGLGVSEREHAALIQTLGIFERGEIKHVSFESRFQVLIDGPTRVPDYFNLLYWAAEQSCGVVCCVGGVVDALMGVNLSGGPRSIANTSQTLREGGRPQLHDLFFPPDSTFDDCGQVTVEQMAQALRSYLVTGDPQWSEVFRLDQVIAQLEVLEGACV